MSQTICDNKQLNFRYLRKHLYIVFFTSLLLTGYYLSIELLKALAVITVIHGIIDYSKIYFDKKLNKDSCSKSKDENSENKNKYYLELFIIDQLLHIFIILLIVPLFYLQENDFVLLFFNKIIQIYPWLGLLSMQRISFIAIVSAVIIFNFKGSTIVVRDTLKKYSSNIEGPGDRGKAIGNLERLLVILFVSLNNYSLIGILFTAKSLIRFKELEKKEIEKGFVEYYLLGSFISILLAILSGILIKMFIHLW